MKEFTYVVQDPQGIHARPAGQLVNEAKKYESRITLIRGEQSADLKRILAVMSMAVKAGESVVVQTTGDDEEIAAEGLEKFFHDNL